MGATANNNEIQDRERRKENLIVFGLPESEKEDRSEKNVEETEKFEALCKDNLGLKTKVKTATRLGPFAENQASPRPIKITVQSQDCRNKIPKAAIKLKDTEDTGDTAKKIFINKDNHDPIRKDRRPKTKTGTRHKKKTILAVGGRSSEMGDQEGKGCKPEKKLVKRRKSRPKIDNDTSKKM